MIELVLIRHAKSDWEDPSLADHDRPLNRRGRANALMMARHFHESAEGPRRLLSSTALRARRTAEAFAEPLGVEVELHADLYASSPTTLWEKAVATGSASVMLVAHNPGITALAADLSRGGIEHMPTCAIARFTWESARWEDAAVAQPRWRLDTPRSVFDG